LNPRVIESPSDAIESGTGVAVAGTGTVTAVTAVMSRARKPVSSDVTTRRGAMARLLHE
jgi:hypothetical protein